MQDRCGQHSVAYASQTTNHPQPPLLNRLPCIFWLQPLFQTRKSAADLEEAKLHRENIQANEYILVCFQENQIIFEASKVCHMIRILIWSFDETSYHKHPVLIQQLWATEQQQQNGELHFCDWFPVPLFHQSLGLLSWQWQSIWMVCHTRYCSNAFYQTRAKQSHILAQLCIIFALIISWSNI